MSASVQSSEVGPRSVSTSSEPLGLTADRATKPSFTKYTVRGRSPWAHKLAPASRVDGVNRQRVPEAMPREHALQSLTGAIEIMGRPSSL